MLPDGDVDKFGMRPSRWSDLLMVEHWRGYLRDPQQYLRHLID